MNQMPHHDGIRCNPFQNLSICVSYESIIATKLPMYGCNKYDFLLSDSSQSPFYMYFLYACYLESLSFVELLLDGSMFQMISMINKQSNVKRPVLRIQYISHTFHLNGRLLFLSFCCWLLLLLSVSKFLMCIFLLPSNFP